MTTPACKAYLHSLVPLFHRNYSFSSIWERLGSAELAYVCNIHIFTPLVNLLHLPFDMSTDTFHAVLRLNVIIHSGGFIPNIFVHRFFVSRPLYSYFIVRVGVTPLQTLTFNSRWIRSISFLVEFLYYCISLQGTPSKFVSLLKSHTINFESLECLVVDEADLIFSFGYEKDFKQIATNLPQIYQAFVMSATFSVDVKTLKKLVLHNPVTLKLKDPEIPEAEKLSQSYIKAEKPDKFLLIYALLKLTLLKGKSIIFVNSIDSCYHLKLFLEKFSIRACVLNSELPQNSRLHIIEEFNKDVYEIIIATDDSIKHATRTTDKPSKKVEKDLEYSVSRGVDFQNIQNVINFDFPGSVEKYIHRIGRTARGTKTGTALSLVSSKEEVFLQQLEERLSSNGEIVLKSYQFKMSEIEHFRYRVNGVVKSISKLAIKNARIREIKAEIFNSSKLQTYFENNPRDLEVLRHDRHLIPEKIEPSMKFIPPYLVPKSMKATFTNSTIKKTRQHPYKAGSNFRKRSRHNPLKTLSLNKPRRKHK